MTSGNVSDSTDEAGADAIQGTTDTSAPELSKELYGKARRTLEEHELASPVGIRFMVDRIDRLEGEVRALSEYREKYFKSEADLRVERGRLKMTSLSDRVSSGLLAAGSAGAGTVASFLEMSVLAIVLFGLFLVVAIASFVIRVRSND